jgi:methyltransferase (TIGR00027 family)
MAPTPVSRSATLVTLARAHLTWMGVVNDPYALQMLPWNRKWLATALRLPGLRRLSQHSTFPYLAARTRFFDHFVSNALEGGIRQVVVLAAGYDSRSWRMARPGVTFFEVDQPATQADKRSRAPEGGPIYVAADVTDSSLVDKLVAASFRMGEPTAFIVEGLAIYLTEDQVADLLRTLAHLSAPGSQLAVSFESGFPRKPITRRVTAAYYGRGGETFRFRLPLDDADAFLSKAGWVVDDVVNSAGLTNTFLSGTKLNGINLNSTAFAIVAQKVD